MGMSAWAFLGGIVGAVLMDVTETYAAKIGITGGVNIALIGGWYEVSEVIVEATENTAGEVPERSIIVVPRRDNTAFFWCGYSQP